VAVERAVERVRAARVERVQAARAERAQAARVERVQAAQVERVQAARVGGGYVHLARAARAVRVVARLARRSSASGSNSGNYSGGSGSGTSKLGSFVFVAIVGLMIYVMYMDDKCRRTPGCKPDQTLPTTNAVDWSGDKIVTSWNTGPNWP
jgi:hypothetical protein